MQKYHLYSDIPDSAIDAGPYWVKLGENNKYADQGIKEGRIYVRWNEVTEDDLNANNWTLIEEKIRNSNRKGDNENRGSSTRQFRMFAMFCASTEDDIWITFHKTKMYWGRLKKDSPVIFGKINREDVKYRELEGGWNDLSMTRKPLNTNELPGALAMLVGMQQTLGAVNSEDFPKRYKILMAVITGEETDVRQNMDEASKSLAKTLIPAIKQLHPSDFEILVDLLFRGAGWKRRTVLGSTMKDVDLEVEEPMRKHMVPDARYRYAVQVKSRATVKEYEMFCDLCNELRKEKSFNEGYLFVHTDHDDLQKCAENKPNDHVQIITEERIAEMVIEFGLVMWLLDRTV